MNTICSARLPAACHGNVNVVTQHKLLVEAAAAHPPWRRGRQLRSSSVSAASADHATTYRGDGSVFSSCDSRAVVDIVAPCGVRARGSDPEGTA
jgi:hypothetical protein